jgi:DNA-binding NtrC family response regulator
LLIKLRHMAKILIVDDDPSMTAVLSELVKTSNHEALAAASPARAMELVREHNPALVLTDIEMPQGKPAGLQLLAQIKDFNRTISVIMLTGHGTKERAVAALRAGAQDFIEKPFAIDELLKRIENALLQQQGVLALAENVTLKRQLRDKFNFENIIGASSGMEKVFNMISRVADIDSTILILGESGTGKELVARALHYHSRRAAMPFIAVNCAAMPEQLLESELFGHRKGAFTGAAFDKVGLFQAADGGSIFLDEIGSMPINLQSKLLRFLQDKELRRVGDTEMTKVDVRVLAATNEPLEARIKDKNFREDLYYRLSVIPIQLPPLRERKDDIPILAAHFVKAIAARQQLPAPHIPDNVMSVLREYNWPGNVRELQNAMERAVALCDDNVIAIKDLPEKLQALPGVASAMTAPSHGVEALVSLKEFLQQQETDYILRAVRVAGDDKQKAAKLLGVSPATIYRKLSAEEETK